jgi:CBS-domain-containing membrane protein
MTDTLTMTITVAESMTWQPLMVRAQDTVEDAFEIMERAGIAACPVVGDGNELCGMVSRVDLLRALRPSRELRLLNANEVSQLKVRDIMRCGVVTVEPEDPLVAAVDLFVDTRLHSLPVVRRASGAPVVVGIVTQGDALRHLMRSAPR